MKLFEKIFKVLAFSIFTVANVNGQDAHFSQYYSSELYLNPALAGSEPDMVFSSNYRTQWRSIVLPYTTSQISLIKPFRSPGVKAKHWGGAGLSFYNDRAGDGNFKTLGVNATFAINIQLSDNNGGSFLSFGVQGGIIQKNVDYTNLEWGAQFNPYVGFDVTVDPGEGQLGDSRLYPDVNAGLVYYYNAEQDFNAKKTAGYFGVSSYHLNNPNESFISGVEAKLPLLYKFHGGILFPVSPKIKLSPNVLGMYQRDVYHINGGLYMTWHLFESSNPVLQGADVILGAWYRYRDSFIFSTGLAHKNYTLGFSYDFNSSNLRTFTQGRGAYEISLTIRKRTEKPLMIIATPRI